MLVRIARVDSIEFDSHSTVDVKGVIANGQVNTGGWTQIQLRPLDGAPQDSRIHLEFVGERPTGMVTQSFVKVHARREVKTSGYVGVVVHVRGAQLTKDF